MKTCIIQPAYSFDYSKADECFSGVLSLLDSCDDSMDLIVLPEYCDTPTVVKSKSQFEESIQKYNHIIMQKAIDTAKRCNAIVFVNAAYKTDAGYRNTTHAINRQGEIVGRYFKAHPAPSELLSVENGGRGMDAGYCYENNEPYTVDIEGVRYGFMTCYDFYFYEAFAPLARKNVDIIIGASHQRTDTHQALDIIGKFLSYNTNSYLVRSSVSLGEDSKVGGCSMVVAPDGSMLVNMENRAGLAVCEIDPKQKYYKPAGFNGTVKSHYEYIEEGRHAQNYRPGGAAITLNNNDKPYPRVCAHRGFNTIAPENSMPAFGAAVALGADEIEFDLWLTKDNQLVSCHDSKLERVSDGEGFIYEHTYEELLKFDFGQKRGDNFAGLKICTFEDILKKFACHTIMNIHVKSAELPGVDFELLLSSMVTLIKKYDCEKYVYFMSSKDEFLQYAGEHAPQIARCVGECKPHFEIVNRAIALGCEKVQLFYPYFNQEMIDLAHSHNIRCNVFFADTPAEALGYLDMGIDTILTNDYLSIANAVKER